MSGPSPGSGAGGRRPGPSGAAGTSHGNGRNEAEADDETLMLRMAEGDQAAFAILVARHMERTVRLAQRLLNDASDADEIAQEAFLRVWRQAERWEPGRALLTTWLYRVVTNLCIDRQRRRIHLPLDDATEVADPSPDAVELIEQRQRGQLLASAMAALPERQRTAIILFHQEGMSLREAAQILEIGEGAFESLLLRGRRALKTALEKAIPGFRRTLP
jgi:RNA polymerase sigma-70 factor (ECF subfamily)